MGSGTVQDEQTWRVGTGRARRRVRRLVGDISAARLLWPALEGEALRTRAFLLPHLEGLPDLWRRTLEAKFYERVTVSDRNLVKRAMRALVRSLAEQDEEFMAAEAAKAQQPRGRGRPPRDYDAEMAAATRVARAVGVLF